MTENLSKENKKYLDSVKFKIQELQNQQDELYKLAIKTLEIEDNDEVFDYVFNDAFRSVASQLHDQ